MSLALEALARDIPASLSDTQVQEYRDKGFLVVDGVVSEFDLAGLRGDIDRFVDGSRHVASHDAKYDLEVDHAPAQPHVRRA